MKVWPIDPLVPRNLRLEVPEKLPQGLGMAYRQLVPDRQKSSLPQGFASIGRVGEQHTWMRGSPQGVIRS